MQQRPLIIVSLVVGLCFVIAACGGSESTPTTTTTAAPTATPTAAAQVPTPTAATSSSTDGASGAMTGRDVFASGICITCHKIESIPAAIGVIGPELSNIGTVSANRVPGLSAEAYIRQSIEEPTAFVVENYSPLMPAGLKDMLSAEQYESLVGYLVGLK